MITAHSGCDGTPDNSLEYIRYALGLSVDAFEVDVRKNSTGELILSHDETEEDAATLREAFLMLKEHPEKKINCDFKQYGLEADVIRLARACGVDRQLIFTGSVDSALFAKGTPVYPDVTWYANTECFPAYEARLKGSTSGEETAGILRELILHMRGYELSGLNWSFRQAEMVYRDAQAAGIGISVWTVNEPDIQRCWLERKAENITTRRPAQLLRMRDELA